MKIILCHNTLYFMAGVSPISQAGGMSLAVKWREAVK